MASGFEVNPEPLNPEPMNGYILYIRCYDFVNYARDQSAILGEKQGEISSSLMFLAMTLMKISMLFLRM